MRKRLTSHPPQRFLWLLICCVGGLTATAHADIRLASPFGDHMVLQSDAPISIWGDGCPGGDTIRLSIAGQSVITRSDWQGRWLVRLAPMKPGGPFQMLIQIGGSGPLVPSSAANDHGGAEINDVMIGKVMLMRESAQVYAGVESRSARVGEHPFAQVRVYHQGASVATTYSGQSANGQLAAHWSYVAQDVLPAGMAAYFGAGHDLHEKLHIPVGIIVVAKGPPCAPLQACTGEVQETSVGP